MFVLTVDQKDSRRVGDRVPDVLAALVDRQGLVLPFERTVGDEVQGVLADAPAVVDLVLDLLRRGGWSVGIGTGAVDLPLPASARAASGAAFVLAREAVEAAKSRARSVPLAVRGASPTAAADAEAVLTLVAAIAARRSTAGWAAIDTLRSVDAEATRVLGGAPLVGPDGPRAAAVVGVARQQEVARRLGVSQQAVSQRLRAALWADEVAARPAAARLLTAAAG